MMMDGLSCLGSAVEERVVRGMDEGDEWVGVKLLLSL